MNVKAGGHIVWRERTYEVVMVTPLAATLRDAGGVEAEVSLDELNMNAEVVEPALFGRSVKLRELAGATSAEYEVWRAAMERIRAVSERRGLTREAVSDEAARLTQELRRPVAPRTVYRRWRAFKEQGGIGLLDGRTGALRAQQGRSVDTRVIEAINTVVAARAKSSTISKSAVLEQVTRLVRTEFGDEVAIPSRATFYRILESEDRGRFSFGSAKTRESLALAPEGEFGRRTALRPGEQVQIDTTRLDVMVRIDESTIGRPELTIMLDVATRSILAAVLRPEGTKSMDLVVVLARALVPYARRPDGARETRQLVSTAWADEALIEQERFERLREAQPFIFPETITTDRGRTYLSRHFRAACETLGISLVTAAPHTPTDKPHVERTFESIASLFLQYAMGYVGRSVEHRGRDVESQSEQLLTIAQMQELLEDWIAVEWQNRSHDGLRDPLHPTIMLTPNEMCRAFRQVAPELHVPLTREDFIALLPAVQRRINRYGVTIDHRVYDSKRLAEYRRRESPAKSKQGRWPIRVDPYNLHVVWLEADGKFIPLRWANDVHEMPMLGDVWRYARDEYRSGGSRRVDTSDLVDAMRGFAAKGNPKAAARRKARAATVAADPMNPTSVARSEVEDASDHAPAITDVAAPEAWPHSGGFALTNDDIDEVRRRLEE